LFSFVQVLLNISIAAIVAYCYERSSQIPCNIETFSSKTSLDNRVTQSVSSDVHIVYSHEAKARLHMRKTVDGAQIQDERRAQRHTRALRA